MAKPQSFRGPGAGVPARPVDAPQLGDPGGRTQRDDGSGKRRGPAAPLWLPMRREVVIGVALLLVYALLSYFERAFLQKEFGTTWLGLPFRGIVKVLKGRDSRLERKANFTPHQCHHELQPSSKGWFPSRRGRRLLAVEPVKSTARSSMWERSLNTDKISLFTTAADSPLSACSQEAFQPYVFDLQLDLMNAQKSPAEPQCSGLDFTSLRSDGLVDVSNCPGTASINKEWRGEYTIVQEDDPPVNMFRDGNPRVRGVRYLWTSCSISGVGCFENFRITAVQEDQPNTVLQAAVSRIFVSPQYKKTNQIIPAAEAAGEARSDLNVLYLFLDSTSSAKFKQLFWQLDAALGQLEQEKLAEIFSFDRTSVFGQNTMPNVQPMFGDFTPVGGETFNNLFDTFQNEGFVPSVMEDYCPDHGVCSVFKKGPHKICSELLCSYKEDITDLFSKNPVPGCIHGRYWATSHTDYITSFWKTYPQKRKFHVASVFGGHTASFAGVTAQDPVYAKLLLNMFRSGMFSRTIVAVVADHGYHHGYHQYFNSFIQGEYQHRNPVMKLVIPSHLSGLVKRTAAKANQNRLVTHLDMRYTLLKAVGVTDIAKLSTSSDGRNRVAYDLLGETIPMDRTCRDARLPDKWCACFRRLSERPETRECSVDTKEGCVIANKKPSLQEMWKRKMSERVKRKMSEH